MGDGVGDLAGQVYSEVSKAATRDCERKVVLWRSVFTSSQTLPPRKLSSDQACSWGPTGGHRTIQTLPSLHAVQSSSPELHTEPGQWMSALEGVSCHSDQTLTVHEGFVSDRLKAPPLAGHQRAPTSRQIPGRPGVQNLGSSFLLPLPLTK